MSEKEGIDSYHSLVEGCKRLTHLLRFLCPNKETFDVDYLEENVTKGLELTKGLDKFNVFGDLEAIYFKHGKYDTQLLLERLKIAHYHDILVFKQNYNRGTYKKSKVYPFLFRTYDLRALIRTADSHLHSTLCEIENFKHHYLKHGEIRNLLKKIPKSKSAPLNTIEDLFESLEVAQLCIDVLKKTEPPIINYDCSFRLGPRMKGAIVAWIDALKDKGLINQQIKDAELAILLNQKFPNLELGKDGRSLRNPGSTAYKKYYNSLKSLLP